MTPGTPPEQTDTDRRRDHESYHVPRPICDFLIARVFVGHLLHFGGRDPGSTHRPYGVHGTKVHGEKKRSVHSHKFCGIGRSLDLTVIKVPPFGENCRMRDDPFPPLPFPALPSGTGPSSLSVLRVLGMSLGFCPSSSWLYTFRSLLCLLFLSGSLDCV